ncbi:MAG: hypothetical protein HPY68_11330 [Candidatus Atribacteria bacterium]|nr:hypothetical protein [Candidatus Atribacteria bacterium]
MPEVSPPALSFVNKSLDRIDRRLEKLEERLLTVEKEVSSLRVWGSILSFLLPSLFLSLLLWRLKLP